jgi:hypothetical protein
LTWYNHVNEGIILFALTLFNLSYYLCHKKHENSIKFDCLGFAVVQLLAIVQLSAFAVVKFAQIFYCHFGLYPLFRDQHLCYPSRKTEASRRETFPCNWSDMCKISEEELVRSGHFFSDIRRTSAVTTCFSCGLSLKWNDLGDDFRNHLDGCPWSNQLSHGRMLKKTKIKHRTLRNILLMKHFSEKVSSIGLISHLVWATFSFRWDPEKWMDIKYNG